MCPSDDALRHADELAAACVRALGRGATAIVLHGSLVLGGYVPGRSDVDLLAITERGLSEGEVEALVAGVAAARRPPVRVDLWVVRGDVASAPTRDALVEVALAVGEEVVVEARGTPDPDLVVQLSVCRAHGRSLAGAPAAEMIGPVPDEWVDEIGVAQLTAWQRIGDDPPHAQLTVLTTCRIWRFAEERRYCSKAAAAEWALERDPTLTAVRDALRQRTDPSHAIDSHDVARLLELVLTRLGQ